MDIDFSPPGIQGLALKKFRSIIIISHTIPLGKVVSGNETIHEAIYEIYEAIYLLIPNIPAFTNVAVP